MAMAHEDIVEIFNRVKFPYSVNKLTSKVAQEAFSNTQGMKDNVRKILEEKKKVVAKLKKLPYVKKVRIPEGRVPEGGEVLPKRIFLYFNNSNNNILFILSQLETSVQKEKKLLTNNNKKCISYSGTRV